MSVSPLFYVMTISNVHVSAFIYTCTCSQNVLCAKSDLSNSVLELINLLCSFSMLLGKKAKQEKNLLKADLIFFVYINLGQIKQTVIILSYRMSFFPLDSGYRPFQQFNLQIFNSTAHLLPIGSIKNTEQ